MYAIITVLPLPDAYHHQTSQCTRTYATDIFKKHGVFSQNTDDVARNSPYVCPEGRSARKFVLTIIPVISRKFRKANLFLL